MNYLKKEYLDKYSWLKYNLSESLGLEGLQSGQNGTFNNKNPKGIPIVDLCNLVHLSLLLKPKYFIEIGTYTGFSIIALAKIFQEENIDCQFTSIEIDKKLFQIACRNKDKIGLKNLTLVNMDGDEFLKDLYGSDLMNETIIFLDGNPISDEFELSKTLNPKAIIGHDMIFNDERGMACIAPRGEKFYKNRAFLFSGELGIGAIIKGNYDSGKN